jgi:hypothetical protein
MKLGQNRLIRDGLALKKKGESNQVQIFNQDLAHYGNYSN